MSKKEANFQVFSFCFVKKSYRKRKKFEEVIDEFVKELFSAKLEELNKDIERVLSLMQK